MSISVSSVYICYSEWNGGFNRIIEALFIQVSKNPNITLCATQEIQLHLSFTVNKKGSFAIGSSKGAINFQ